MKAFLQPSDNDWPPFYLPTPYYWKDYHKSWWKDVLWVREEPVNVGAVLDQGADLGISADFSKNNFWLKKSGDLGDWYLRALDEWSLNWAQFMRDTD